MGLEERDPRPGAAGRGAGRHPRGGSRSWGRRRGGTGSDRRNCSRQPLFLEQLLAFVQEAGPSALGAVPRRSKRCSPADSSVSTRPRAGADRARASVAGRDFRAAGSSHCRREELAGLDSRLRTLVRRGLVRALRGADDDTYRFHHVLVRDVAYAGTTKGARAELHERYGTWLEQRGRAMDEIVGYHLEQAYRYPQRARPRRSGCPRPCTARRSRVGCGRDWRVEASGCKGGCQPPRPCCVAAPAGEAKRAEILCELGMTLSQLGDSAAADAAFTQAIDEAEAVVDDVSAAWSRIELARARLHRGGDPRKLVALVQAATPLFEEAENERALGRAWRARVRPRLSAGTLRGRLDASERARRYYRRSGWSTAGCLSETASALYHGQRPYPRRWRCERLLEEATDRPGTAHVLAYLAGLHACDGRGDEAVRLLDEADNVYRDLQDDYSLANTSGRIRGRVHAVAEDHEAAQAAFRACCETFERFDDSAALASVAAELGGSLSAQGGSRRRGWAL